MFCFAVFSLTICGSIFPRCLGRSPWNFAEWCELGAALYARSKNWGAPKKFLGKPEFKVCRKIQRILVRTLRSLGITSPNLYKWCAARQRWKFGYNFWGACAVKNFPALDLARFRTTLYFDRKYLRNGWKYPKSETTTPPTFNEKHKLWSTNNGAELSHFDLPNVKFFGRPDLAVRGCCPSIFTRVTEWQITIPLVVRKLTFSGKCSSPGAETWKLTASSSLEWRQT